mmetsp:Transcript_14412/g.40980  ORF Transcript_14412/g.40980 Transcript_14412/m.40980 type:complete len:299 (-) Transcript_14412:760-1656(-)
MRSRMASVRLSSVTIVWLLTISHITTAYGEKPRERTYIMQHSFGGGESGQQSTEWEECGVLKTRVAEKVAHRGGPTISFKGIKVAHNSMSPKAREEMTMAANSGGYYRLRIASNPTTGSTSASSETDFVVTSVKASCLAASNFRDHFNLHFDDSGTTLVSADHVATGVDCPAVEENPGKYKIGGLSEAEASLGPTTTSIKFSKLAPSLSVITKRRRSSDKSDDDGSVDLDLSYEDDEDDAEGGGPPKKDERTWIQKNWMLCLAGGMMIMNLMGSILEPPRQQQQRRGASGQQAAGPQR